MHIDVASKQQTADSLKLIFPRIFSIHYALNLSNFKVFWNIFEFFFKILWNIASIKFNALISIIIIYKLKYK